MSLFNVMPTCHNPSGKKAYITNIFTKYEYRRKVIATHILDLPVKDGGAAGVRNISLEPTEMGRNIYEKYGFVKLENEMEYVIDY